MSQSRKNSLGFLGYIPFSWFVFFLALPLVLVLVMSFQKRGVYGGVDWVFSFDNYLRALDPVYLKIFFRSFILAFSTTGLCLILSYPLSWALVTLPQRVRNVFLLLLLIPFLTNLLIRIYAIKVFTGFDGPLVSLYHFLGIDIDPFSLSQNIYLVMYGMVTTYLPFMIFPLFSAMERMNFSLVEAAQDLGASQIRILFRIIVPTTWRAALTGATLVFIPCLGEYLIPDLLGGAKNMLMGNLITEQYLKARDWPFGSALAMMLVLLLVIFLVVIKFLNKNSEKKIDANAEDSRRV